MHMVVWQLNINWEKSEGLHPLQIITKVVKNREKLTLAI